MTSKIEGLYHRFLNSLNRQGHEKMEEFMYLIELRQVESILSDLITGIDRNRIRGAKPDCVKEDHMGREIPKG